ncbi:MAG TPA: biopolymer transporter ExbD [Fibrobacteria bacterium]|nr:biopolymer transporter ExbD [Fibrobacteria bacterium]
MIPTVRKRRKKDVEIAIVNLVDVIFILLIFFIMTTTFSKETGLDITKPAAGSAGQLEKENILVGISKEGTIHLDERQVDLAMLQAILRRELAEDADRAVVIISDRDADMGAVVDVMDECNLAGVRKVSVAANQEGK